MLEQWLAHSKYLINVSPWYYLLPLLVTSGAAPLPQARGVSGETDMAPEL